MQSQILNILNQRDVRVTELTAFSSLTVYLSTISGISLQLCSRVEFDTSSTVMSNHRVQCLILLSASRTYSHLPVPLLLLEPMVIATTKQLGKAKHYLS